MKHFSYLALLSTVFVSPASASTSSVNVDINVVHGSIVSSSTQGISFVGFSGKTFVGGVGSANTIVGQLGAIMNPVSPPAACAWSLSGKDAAKFAVDGTTGVVKVGSIDLPTSDYQWTATCTQNGAVMSPFSQSFTVSAVNSTTPTIEMIGGPIFNTGDTITFKVRNAPTAAYSVFLGELHGHQDGSPGHMIFNAGQWEGSLMHTIAAGNPNTTVSFTVPDQKQGPNDAYEQHYIVSLSATGNYSGELAESAWFSVNPTYDRQPPTATSPSFSDPFTPQHTVTVCPSGCDYSSLHTAVLSVPDFTLVKIKAIQKGFYRDCVSVEGPNWGGPGGGSGGPNITHIWVKGVSGDGDFVRMQAPPPYLGTPCAEPGNSGGHGVFVIGRDPLDVTVENIEISDCDGDSNEGCFYLIGQAPNHTVRLRNVYVHDGENLVSFAGENEGLSLTVENSHFVRGGHNYGGWQHNLYIGGCDPTAGPPCRLDFHNNISEQTVAAHELKTRETTSNVNCNLFKEAYNPLHQGSADIDFSEGREAILTNNTIAMGPAADPNNNDLVRWGLDQEYLSPSVRYLSMQGNLFINDGINDGGNSVGYVEYGPRPYQAGSWASTGQVPPGNRTGNTWVNAWTDGPIFQEIPSFATAPLRKDNTFYTLQSVVRVPDNPTYLFAVEQNGTTGTSEPAGFACPGACPSPHGANPGTNPATQIVDGTTMFMPILPGVPLAASGETFFPSRSAAGLGPTDFPMPAVCSIRPVGNVTVPTN